MYLKYISDIDDPAFSTCDISFTEGDALTSAVYMSIFCWARGTYEEAEGRTRYGYWHDVISGDTTGSKLWTQLRAKILPKTVPRIKQILEDCLQWMITDNICHSIDVLVWQEFDQIKSQISINKNDGSSFNLKFEDLWKDLITNRTTY